MLGDSTCSPGWIPYALHSCFHITLLAYPEERKKEREKEPRMSSGAEGPCISFHQILLPKMYAYFSVNKEDS